MEYYYRPESYREDTLKAEELPNGADAGQLYRDLGSAAESGWDFSTRWLVLLSKSAELSII